MAKEQAGVDKRPDEQSGSVKYVEIDGESYALVPKAEYQQLTETAYLLSTEANAAQLREGLDFFERNTPSAKILSGPEDEAHQLNEAEIQETLEKIAAASSTAARISGQGMTADPWTTRLHHHSYFSHSFAPLAFAGGGYAVEHEAHCAMDIVKAKVSKRVNVWNPEFPYGKVSPARPEHPPKVGSLRKRNKTSTG
jgi:hypothetical protein